MFLNNFNKEEKSAFLALAKGMIAADAVVDENEKLLLEEFLKEMGMNQSDVEVMTVEAALETMQSSVRPIKKQAYFELVGLSLCDNDMDESEKELLSHVADCFNFSAEETAQLNQCAIDLLDAYKRLAELVSK